MRRNVGRALVVSVVFWGCSTVENAIRLPDEPVGGEQARSTGSVESDGDICAPGKAPDADKNPDAPCALKREYYAPDLTVAGRPAPKGGPMKVLNAAGTCNGKTGTGYTTCGNGSENCCARAVVPAGIAGDAQVADGFALGVYEVTVARFAAFVDAFGGNLRSAATKAGLDYAAHLPASRAEVDQELGPACKHRSNVAEYGALTWPSQDITNTVASLIPDDNDRAADIRADATASRLMAKPVNCVSYYMASAFCAWDGGRLPMNAEWAYVAIGGGELREYPWGSRLTGNRLVTNLAPEGPNPVLTYPEDFPYFGNGHNAYHIAPPGRKPAGVSRWGHHDMGGNVLEWMGDLTKNPGTGAIEGMVRGGSWEGHDVSNANGTHVNYPLDRTYGSLGFRCAYGPKPPPPLPKPATIEMVPVYRSVNRAIGDHLQGLTKGEGAPAYEYEGISFWLSRNELPGQSTAIYRCLSRQHHFLSTDAACEGMTSEGRLGYTLKNATDGAKLVYSCRHPTQNDRGWTLTPQECTDAEYVVEGTWGYAFSSSGGEKAIHH